MRLLSISGAYIFFWAGAVALVGLGLCHGRLYPSCKNSVPERRMYLGSIPIAISLTRGFLKMKGSLVVHGYLYVYLQHNKNLTTDL